MANEKFDNDPFDKYDYLFEEQEKKYQKQNNSRYKLTKTPSKKVIDENNHSPKRQATDKELAVKMFGLVFIGFLIIRLILADGTTIRSALIPIIVISIVIYSFIKNMKKR